MMNAPITAHKSFTIERKFQAAPSRVFRAWADPVAKRRWSDCHAEAGLTEHIMDFRPGGQELARQTLPDGRRQEVLTVYLDIVENVRMVFAYSMSVEGRGLSASLVTLELHPESSGAVMLFTEQLAYLDGYDDFEERRRGTEEGFDRLALDVISEVGEAN